MIVEAKGAILNTFLNILNTHPLTVNYFLFGEKAEIFNSHFASQCTPINNSSVLSQLENKTNERLASVDIKKDDIYLILKNLNPEKAHG